MFIGWYSKKPITISIEKWFWLILTHFSTLHPQNRHFYAIFSPFRCIFSQKGLWKHYFWFCMDIPHICNKNCHKIKTSVKKFSKVFLKIYWNFKKVVFYLLDKNHCTQYGPEKVTFIFFGQNTCHVLELCEKINWISLKAFLWRPLKKRQYFLRWCNFYDVYCKHR